MLSQIEPTDETHERNDRRTCISLILPFPYRGGTQRLLRTLAQYFLSHDDIELVLAVPSGYLSGDEAFAEWIAEQIPHTNFCEFDWQEVSKEELIPLCHSVGIDVENVISERYVIPVDKKRLLSRSDFWFFLSDRIVDVLVPLKPYGIFITDHLHRYFAPCFHESLYADQNSLIWNFNRNIRNAQICVASTEGTIEDIKSFSGACGVILKVPLGVEVDKFQELLSIVSGVESKSSKNPYFLWVTNTAPHKNHLNGIKSLEVAFPQLSGDWSVTITGYGTNLFDPGFEPGPSDPIRKIYNDPYIAKVRKAFGSLDSDLLARIEFAGEVDDVSYARYLKGAEFLWHNVIADNGTYSVLEAAIFGVPSVSSDYPQMREISELYGLDLVFYDPLSVDSTVQALISGKEMKRPQPSHVISKIKLAGWEFWGPTLKASIVASAKLPSVIRCL